MTLPRPPRPFSLAGLLALLFLLVLVLGPSLPAQCAMCKEAVDADKAAGGGIADGIAYSILFMLSLPLLILSGFSLALWRASRRAADSDSAG